MKKITNVFRGSRLTLLATLVLLVYSNTGCAMLTKWLSEHKPELRIAGFSIDSMNLEGMSLALDMIVENPYPVDFPAVSPNLSLSLEGNKLTTIQSEPIGVKGNSSAEKKVLLNVKYSDLLKFIQQFQLKEKIQFQVAGSLDYKLQNVIPGLPNKVSLPIQAQRDIPVIVPEIDIRNFDLTTPETILDPFKTKFEIVIRNKSQAKFAFDALKFDFSLQNQSFLKSKAENISNEGTQSIIPIETSISLINAGTALLKTFSARNLAFKLDGETNLKFPAIADLNDDGVLFSFNKQGTLLNQ